MRLPRAFLAAGGAQTYAFINATWPATASTDFTLSEFNWLIP